MRCPEKGKENTINIKLLIAVLVPNTILIPLVLIPLCK